MFYFNCCLYLRLGDIHSLAQGLMLSILFCDGQSMYVLQFLFSKYSGLIISLTPFSHPGSAMQPSSLSAISALAFACGFSQTKRELLAAELQKISLIIL